MRLDVLEPGGATTGRLLPTGNSTDILDVPELGRIEVSLVDAANACVFVAAASLGLQGSELPADIATRVEAMAALAAIREHASVAMGIAPTLDAARAKRSVPFVGFVSPPQASATLSGATVDAAQMDLSVRMLSNGKPHLALPLTASLCTAVAARLPGSVVARCLPADAEGRLRLGMPSGVLTVDADVVPGPRPAVRSGAFFRTARRLFDGTVYG